MTNFLFYILVSEQQKEPKVKMLQMRGPFIHMKPIEIVKSEYQRYLISNEELLSEKRFITKKFQSEIPLWYNILVPNKISLIITTCKKCGVIQHNSDDLSNTLVKCTNCKTENKLPYFNTKNYEEFKKDMFYKAEKFLKGKFETMVDNYQMCT